MTHANPEFSIIIVTHNSNYYLVECMKALTTQRNKNFEIIIVDNNSNEDLINFDNFNSLEIKIIKLEKNFGFAAANNIGAKRAIGKWLITLNPDAIPDDNWLSEIEVGIKRYPKNKIFGSKQLKYDNPSKLDGAGDHYHCTGIAWRGGEGDSAETILEDAVVMSPCAAAAIYHRDIYVSMGGMAEYFFCYYEDVDLGLRFRLLGHETIQLAGAKVRHVGSTTAGKNSKFIKYYVSRNRIWTFIRCVPGLLFAVCLPLLILSIVTRLCFSIFAGDTSTKLKAFFDAFRRLLRIWNDRKVIQKARKSSVLQFGSDMTWSIGKLILRSSDCRPISPEKFSKEPGAPFQAGGLDGS